MKIGTGEFRMGEELMGSGSGERGVGRWERRVCIRGVGRGNTGVGRAGRVVIKREWRGREGGKGRMTNDK